MTPEMLKQMGVEVSDEELERACRAWQQFKLLNSHPERVIRFDKIESCSGEPERTELH